MAYAGICLFEAQPRLLGCVGQGNLAREVRQCSLESHTAGTIISILNEDAELQLSPLLNIRIWIVTFLIQSQGSEVCIPSMKDM